MLPRASSNRPGPTHARHRAPLHSDHTPVRRPPRRALAPFALAIVGILAFPALAGCLGENPIGNIKPPAQDREGVPLPEIVSVPEVVNAGIPFAVGWRIAEAARTPEAAHLYFGDESILDPESGPEYPFKIGIPVIKGKGSVTVTTPVTYETVYMRLAVKDGNRTFWTGERAVPVIDRGAPASVIILQGPDYVKVGDPMTVRFEVRSNRIVNDTRVELRLGTGNATEDNYPHVIGMTSGGAPGFFTVKGKPAADGTHQYRVRVIINNVSYWSAPRTILVGTEGEPSVELESFLSWARTTESFSARWRIEFPGHARMNNTQIRWGNESHATEPAPTPAMYPGATREQSGNIPGTFSATWSIPIPGTYYMRIRVLHEGADHWSQEYPITVAK